MARSLDLYCINLGMYFGMDWAGVFLLSFFAGNGTCTGVVHMHCVDFIKLGDIQTKAKAV
jgi:hypothetical protein